MVRFRLAAVLTALVGVLISPAPGAAAAPGPVVGAVAGVSVAGGDVLTNPAGGRCTLGFNVTGRGILAGRCGPVGTRWYAGTVPVGVVGIVFGGTQLTLIGIDNPAVVQLHGIRNGATLISITAAARSFVGQSVREMSPVTGLHSGTVTAINATVTFPEGTVTGLDRTTLCPEAGGTGAPVFAGSTGLSMAVGGSGNCSTGGTTFSQPIVPLLAQTGRAIF